MHNSTSLTDLAAVRIAAVTLAVAPVLALALAVVSTALPASAQVVLSVSTQGLEVREVVSGKRARGEQTALYEGSVCNYGPAPVSLSYAEVLNSTPIPYSLLRGRETMVEVRRGKNKVWEGVKIAAPLVAAALLASKTSVEAKIGAGGAALGVQVIDRVGVLAGERAAGPAVEGRWAVDGEAIGLGAYRQSAGGECRNFLFVGMFVGKYKLEKAEFLVGRPVGVGVSPSTPPSPAAPAAGWIGPDPEGAIALRRDFDEERVTMERERERERQVRSR